jgi:hypothetical protein
MLPLRCIMLNNQTTLCCEHGKGEVRYDLIKIFQDHTKEKINREVGHSNRSYLKGQWPMK